MASSRSFKDLAQVALANYTGRDPSFPNRLKIWIDFFHDSDISSLTSDDIEDALDHPVARGKLRRTLTASPTAGRSTTRVAVLVPTGRPLKQCVGLTLIYKTDQPTPAEQKMAPLTEQHCCHWSSLSFAAASPISSTRTRSCLASTTSPKRCVE